MEKKSKNQSNPRLLCSLFILSAALLGSAPLVQANEILNPVSPNTTVVPEQPSALPRTSSEPSPSSEPTPPTSSEPTSESSAPPQSQPEQSTPVSSTKKEKAKKQEHKHSSEKRKKFFAEPDFTANIEHIHELVMHDGGIPSHTQTGEMLSIMAGNLLFGNRSKA